MFCHLPSVHAPVPASKTVTVQTITHTLNPTRPDKLYLPPEAAYRHLQTLFSSVQLLSPV